MDDGPGRERLRFTVLGPVRAWRDATPLAAGSPQQRALLAALLLRGGRTATDLASHRAEGATDVAVAGSHVVIDVQIVVDPGARIPDVAHQVRRQITRHITAHTGLTTAEVNVNVVDVTHHRP